MVVVAVVVVVVVVVEIVGRVLVVRLVVVPWWHPCNCFVGREIDGGGVTHDHGDQCGANSGVNVVGGWRSMVVVVVAFVCSTLEKGIWTKRWWVVQVQHRVPFRTSMSREDQLRRRLNS